jgi:hypothetical protein
MWGWAIRSTTREQQALLFNDKASTLHVDVANTAAQ